MYLEKKTARWNVLFRLFISAFLVCVIVAAARSIDLQNPYLPFAIAGASVFYLRCSSSLREKVIWVIASLCLLPMVNFPVRSGILAFSAGLALLGFGAFLILALRAVWSDHDERQRMFAQLGPAAMVVFFVYSAQHALGMATLLHPKTYDLYLYLMDGSLGFQAGFAAGRLMASSKIVSWIALVVYLSLPLYQATIYAFRVPRNATRPSWEVIALLLLAGIGGWALFNVVPATGPRYFFVDFPDHPQPYHALSRIVPTALPISAAIPRNAIPSLHMTWVLLLLWCSRGMSRGVRIGAWIYAAITAFATLGTGEHYVVDLVASLPYALLIKAVVLPDGKVDNSTRFGSISVGAVLTFGWLFTVRYAVKWMLISPLLPWLFVLGTVGIVLIFERKLSLAVVTVGATLAAETVNSQGTEGTLSSEVDDVDLVVGSHASR